MKMKNTTKLTFLERWAKFISLWMMKTAYKGMNEAERLEARNDAAIRIWQLKSGDLEDLKIAEMWIEFYNWTITYGDK